MNKISDFKSRLEEVLSERNLRAAWICRETGISKGTISQYLKGVYEPKREQLCRIAEALEVTPEWLEGYDAVKLAGDMPELVCKIGVHPMGNLNIPLRYAVCDPQHKENIYVEADDHFYPAVNEGDIVMVERTDTLDDGQAGVISFREHKGLYIYKLCSDGVELCCLNAYYPPLKVRGDELCDMKIHGRVIMSIRKW